MLGLTKIYFYFPKTLTNYFPTQDMYCFISVYCSTHKIMDTFTYFRIKTEIYFESIQLRY